MTGALRQKPCRDEEEPQPAQRVESWKIDRNSYCTAWYSQLMSSR